MNKAGADQPLKLVFLGGGVNSAIGRMHFISSQLDRKFEVVGGMFSRDSSVQQSTESYYKINNPIHFENLDNFASRRDQFDAVVILTPTPLHFEAIEFMMTAMAMRQFYPMAIGIQEMNGKEILPE